MHLHQMEVDSTHTDSGVSVNQLQIITNPDHRGVVVHDHNYQLPNDPEQWHLIVSQRRDLARQSMSICLSELTQNYGQQQSNDNLRCRLDLNWVAQEQFRHICHNSYYDLLRTQVTWEAVSQLYMEDFFENPQHLTEQLGGSTVLAWNDPRLTLPGPNLKTTIVNYDECVEHCASVEQLQTQQSHSIARVWFAEYAQHIVNSKNPTPDLLA